MTTRNKLLCTMFLLCAVICTTKAQETWSGKIIDAQTGEALPYASIYIETLRSGSVSNEVGAFKFSLPQGKHRVEVRSLGYTPQHLHILVPTGGLREYTIRLKAEEINMSEVVVTGKRSKEDPAYPIMRRVMYRVPYFRTMLEEYEVEIFTRGSIAMQKSGLLGGAKISDNNIKLKDITGKTFVSEAHARLRYTAPDTYKQTILAERSSLPKEFDFEIINASDVTVRNVYDAVIGYEELGMGAVNPLTPQAYNRYRYRLEGRSELAGKSIYHISFTARDGVKVSGKIDVIGDSWAVSMLQLSLHSAIIREEQTYLLSEVKPGIYLPTTYSTASEFSALGLRGTAKYYSSCHYKDIKLSRNGEELAQMEKNNPVPSTDLLTGSFLRRHEMNLAPKKDKSRHPYDLTSTENNGLETTKDSLSETRDQTYWENISTIPMSEEELQSFAQKDSLRKVMRLKPEKKDSTERSFLLWKMAAKIINGGRLYRDSLYTLSLEKGLANTLLYGYNRADRIPIGGTLALVRNNKDKTLWRISAGVSYAEGRKAWLWNTALHIYPDYRHNAIFTAEVGRKTTSLTNETSDISYLYNSLSTLLNKKGDMSLYEQRYARLSLAYLFTPYCRLQATLSHEKALSLPALNLGKSIASTHRFNNFGIAHTPVLEQGFIPVSNTAVWLASVSLQWRMAPYHHRSKTGWVYYDKQSQTHPVITTRVSAAHGTSEQASRFVLLEAGIRQRMETSRYSRRYFGYHMRAGFYLYKKHVAPEHAIFLKGTNALIQTATPLSAFYTPPPFTAVSQRSFVLGGVNYESKRLLLNHLPLSFLRLGTEDISLKSFVEPHGKPYLEAGYSWGLQNMRIGFYWGYDFSRSASGAALRMEFPL